MSVSSQVCITTAFLGWESGGGREGNSHCGGEWSPWALTCFSLPSSSSAWLLPRLPQNTSSVSTENHCRGATPRAETSQSKSPLPPPRPPPPAATRQHLHSTSLCAHVASSPIAGGAQGHFQAWAQPSHHQDTIKGHSAVLSE